MADFPYPHMDERLSKHKIVESERGALTGYFKVRHPEESFYWFQVSYAPGGGGSTENLKGSTTVAGEDAQENQRASED